MNKGNNLLNVCACIDDNYAQHCGVMLCSLFENNHDSKFRVHILITSITDVSKGKLVELITKYDSTYEFYSINSEILDGVQFRERRPLSVAAYFRVLLSSVLDHSISKVLYLDCDMVIAGDISLLFQLNLDGYALAATRDVARMPDEHRMQLSLAHGKPYFNSGVMIINLDFWRENKSERDLIAFSKKERKVYCHDQDALNAVFKDDWIMLSPKWNKNYPYIFNSSHFENKLDRRDFEKRPVIIHYIDHFKPWNKIVWVGVKWNRYKKLYYKYLRLTPDKDFKANRLSLKPYVKFGLYRALVKFSLRRIFIDEPWIFFDCVELIIDKFLSLPFLLILKIYYKISAK